MNNAHGKRVSNAFINFSFVYNFYLSWSGIIYGSSAWSPAVKYITYRYHMFTFLHIQKWIKDKYIGFEIKTQTWHDFLMIENKKRGKWEWRERVLGVRLVWSLNSRLGLGFEHVVTGKPLTSLWAKSYFRKLNLAGRKGRMSGMSLGWGVGWGPKGPDLSLLLPVP